MIASVTSGVRPFRRYRIRADKTTKEPVNEAQMATLMANLLAENVIAGRTNASFARSQYRHELCPSLIITKEQVDTVVAAVRNAIQKTF